MSRAASVAYNPTLTSFAHGLAPDLSKGLADILAPEVVVPAGMGQYKKFNDEQAFRIYETRRAMGGKGRRIEFEATDPKFDCSPNALEISIDDDERTKAGADNESRLEEAKTKVLVSSAALARESHVLAAYDAGTIAEAGAGIWTDAGVDPIDELDEILAALATQTGMMPSDLAIGLPAFQQMRKHPKIKALGANGESLRLTAAKLAELLLFPVQVHIGILSKAVNKPGKAGGKANMIGARIYAVVNTPSPTEYDPSAAKTFTTNAGGVRGVKKYREEPHADILLVDWSEEIQMTGTACVKRIDVTTGPIA